VVVVLVHPRHWRTDPAGNLRDDIRRAVEGLRYAPRPAGPAAVSAPGIQEADDAAASVLADQRVP
jgi:hypothetical protein